MEEVVQGAVRALHPRVVGVVGVPLGLLCAAGFLDAGDHRVLAPERLQFALGGMAAALCFRQAFVLAGG
ncbi:hypothetical protein D9M69_670660 [compost metagenome]